MHPYQDPSLPAVERVADLVGRMTLDEKLGQMVCIWPESVPDADPVAMGAGSVFRVVGGSDRKPLESAKLADELQRRYVTETRLGIPALLVEEALMGVSVPYATIFPSPLGMASTFDPELIEQLGATIRVQMQAVGVKQAFAPVADVARDPRWGRIEETYGEDPFLCGSMSTAYITGIQGDDEIVATLKHFVAYGAAEGGRNMHGAHVGPRELREIYATPFEMAVRLGHARGVMSSYNQVDGVPVQAQRALLTDLLRGEWGFEGMVTTDYGSAQQLYDLHFVCDGPVDAAAVTLLAGTDSEVPPSTFAAPLKAALALGYVSDADIDQAVSRILQRKVELGLFEDPYSRGGELVDDRALAHTVARESIVLLHNPSGLLPLSPTLDRIAVIGPNADRPMGQLGDYSYVVISGAIKRAIGEDSELAQALEEAAHRPFSPTFDADSARQLVETVPIVTLLEGIRAAAPEAEVVHVPGCPVVRDELDGIAAAVEAARAADVAVVVVGDQSGILVAATVGEMVDGLSCELPGRQRELVEAVAATGTPTVVVLTNGRPFVLGWMKDLVGAVVEAWAPGEEGGHAVADVLFGHYNPAGRSPVSFPSHVGVSPCPYNRTMSGASYHDGLSEPVFCFGHGLSYTTFEYSSLELSAGEISTEGSVLVSCLVRNTGDRPGDEVVQLYVRDLVARSSRPIKELKGFTRVSLQPSEEIRVTFTLHAERTALYDPSDGWVVEPGAIAVMVGASSEDIRLRDELTVTGEVRAVAQRVLTTPVELSAPVR